jgi:hypothetical protein
VLTPSGRRAAAGLGYDLSMAVKPGPDESEDNRLRDEYKRANLRYNWAVREMLRQAQSVPHEDFNKFAKYVRETRAETAEARRALKGFESKQEHDSLRQEYQATVHNFRASIDDLVVLVKGNSARDSDFNLAHWRIRAARRACKVARDALEK